MVLSLLVLNFESLVYELGILAIIHCFETLLWGVKVVISIRCVAYSKYQMNDSYYRYRVVWVYRRKSRKSKVTKVTQQSRGFPLSIFMPSPVFRPLCDVLEAFPASLDTLISLCTLPVQGTKKFMYVCTYTAL